MSIIIGIAGGTGSGKTTIARQLLAALPDGACALIEHDAYYRDRSHLPAAERKGINYDHPDAVESELLATQLTTLKAGEPIEVPMYDFVTHTRRDETVSVHPMPVVMVEGIHTLANAAIRAQLDIKVFVDTDPDIRVFRRVARDLKERGRSFESIEKQYYRFVRPMHREHVEPSKQFADLIIPEGGSNHVAIDILVARLTAAAHEA